MAVWPANLPVPVADGYSIEPQQTFIRSDMDQGPARQRRRFTTAPTMYSVSWIMDESELGIFESWYRDEADDGAGWFDVSLRNGAGMQSVAARFVSPWKASIVGLPYYRVSAQIEVRNRPVETRSF